MQYYPSFEGNHIIEHRLLYREGAIVDVLQEKQSFSTLEQRVSSVPDEEDGAINTKLQALNANAEQTVRNNLATLEKKSTKHAKRKDLLQLRSAFEKKGATSPESDLLQTLRSKLPTSMQGMIPESKKDTKNDQKQGVDSKKEPGGILNAIAKGFTEGSIGTKVAYVAAGVVGALGLRWAWNKMSTWMKWAAGIIAGGFTAKTIYDLWQKETSADTWIGRGLQFLGISPNPQNDENPSAKTDSNNDNKSQKKPNGVMGVAQGAIDATTDMLGPTKRATEKLLAEDIMGALSEQIGGLFLNEKGEIVILDTIGRPIASPIKATMNMLQAVFTGSLPDGFAMQWTDAGTAYFIGKKAFEALTGQGKQLIPSKIGALKAGARILAGPTEMLWDVAKICNIYRNTGGKEALKTYITQQGLLGKIMGITKNVRSITSEAQALKSLQQWDEVTSMLSTIKAHSSLFADTGLENVCSQVKTKHTKALLDFLQNNATITNPTLQELKKGINTNLDDFGRAIGEATAKMKTAANVADAIPVAEVVEDAAQAVKTGAKAVDSGADALQATKAATNNIPVAEVIDDVSHTTQAAVKATDTGADALRATATTADEAKNIVSQGRDAIAKKMKQIIETLTKTRDAKDVKEFLKTLRQYLPALEIFSKESKVAQCLLGFWKTIAPFGKVAVRYIPVLMTLYDGIMIGVNRMDIAEAEKNGNAGMIEVLKSKEKTLLLGGGTSLAIGFAGVPGLAIAPAVALGTVISSKIYDSLITWEKSSTDWKKLQPAELDLELKKIDATYFDYGHRASTTAHNPLIRPFLSQENIDAQNHQISTVNANIRREILTAYFLQTVKIQPIAGESIAQFQDRTKIAIQDCLRYIDRMTDGTYLRNPVMPAERFYEPALRYAEMKDIQRGLRNNNMPEQLRYEFNGETRILDFNDLAYINTPKSKDVATNDKNQMKMLQAIHQYEGDIVLLQKLTTEYQKALAEIS